MRQPGPDRRDERGQASPEYAGLVLLVAVLLAGLIAIAPDWMPGAALPRAVAAKLVCAVGSVGSCGESAAELAARPTPLQRAYGAELAALIAARTPTLWFEDDDFASLPVDYRECRERTCSDTIRHGSIEHTQTGLEPTAFTHVVDCRDPEAAAREGYECAGPWAGNVYVQFWLYYPDSATRGYGRLGFHRDDWESYQVRTGTDGVAARASSHHGYNGADGGLGSVRSDLGTRPRSAWDAVSDELHVAAGSHAGMAAAQEGDSRRVEPENLRLLPLEPIAAAGDAPPFAVTPPWEKEVWADPESMTT